MLTLREAIRKGRLDDFIAQDFEDEAEDLSDNPSNQKSPGHKGIQRLGKVCKKAVKARSKP